MALLLSVMIPLSVRALRSNVPVSTFIRPRLLAHLSASYGTGDGSRDDNDRVFVSGIPETVGWPELKDHFKLFGPVAYASISEDRATGQSKGVGVVQFERAEDAAEAIRVARDHPLQGKALFVREDVQDRDRRKSRERRPPGEGASEKRGSRSAAALDRRKSRTDAYFEARDESPPSSTDARGAPLPPSSSSPPLSSNGGVRPGVAAAWGRAFDDEVETSEEAERLVDQYLADRDQCRGRGEFDKADQIRSALEKKGIKVDDRRKVWWRQPGVPRSVRDAQGEGKWKQGAWKCLDGVADGSTSGVDHGLVRRLLKERDAYREAKDFANADAILADLKAELGLVLDDAKRTWRVAWTCPECGNSNLAFRDTCKACGLAP